ncbi:MAG: AAA family ATPase [Theionarchaea archaeon]|nr:AAA family ATPase [Theionarchaea archaeon]
MWFRTLEMKGIRHFSEKRIDFAEGLNIVYGPNESGKSTILDSLLASLLKPGHKEISSLKQWDTPYSEIKLIYMTSADTFTITRMLHPHERDVLEGEELFLENSEKIEEVLEDHLGFADRTLFENSTVVKQNEMQILEEEGSRAVIKNRVKALLSGVPERSTDEALAFLENNIAEAESFLNQTEERVNTIEQELQQFKRIDEQLTDVKTRLGVYESDLKRDQSLLTGYEILLEYREAERQHKTLVVKLEEVENLEGYRRKLPIREKELVEELRKELEKISGQQDKLITEKRKTTLGLREQKKNLSVIDDQLEEARTEKESIFAKLFSFMKSSRAKKEELSTKRVEISQNVARLEDLLGRYEEQIADMRQKFQQKGERLENLMQQCREYENWSVDLLESKKKEYESKIEEILQGMTKEELEGKITDKREEADTFRASLVKEHPDLKNREDTERVAIEKEKLAEIITEWEEKIEGLRAQQELFSSKAEKRESLTEELKMLKKERKEEVYQRKADKIAYDVITLVYQDLKERFAPDLERRAEMLLDRITQGKYKDIVVRKEDLDVLVKVPEKSEPVTAEVLSQGTRDQLYLSLRIALSELLSGEKNLPLLFDEAFYTFDEERLQETLSVLQEIAETTQVVVFTHDESYAEYGHAIPLK